MKKIGEYTTRGSIQTDLSINRIILFDGKFDTAYKVVEFQIAPHDMDSTSLRLFTAKLMTDDDAATGVNWNWDNNEEIAWANTGYDANGPSSSLGTEYSLVDPDNLVVEDLYILADEPALGSNVKMNYFIRLEKYDITDSQGALAMVRNRSQA
jgi:hypothetical protein